MGIERILSGKECEGYWGGEKEMVVKGARRITVQKNMESDVQRYKQ